MINIAHNIALLGMLDNRQAQGAYSGIITSLIFWPSTAEKNGITWKKCSRKLYSHVLQAGKYKSVQVIFYASKYSFFSGEHFLNKNLNCS